MGMLDNITTAKEARPVRMVVHGVGGVGKTTFAAGSEKPLIICAEDGAHNLTVPRTGLVTDFTDLLDGLRQLYKAKPRQFNTIVIDTADAVEHLAIAHVCKENNKSSIEDFGYGKGAVYLREAFAKFLNGLQYLSNAGYGIVVLCHSAQRRVDDPTVVEAYEAHGMRLDKVNAAMLREWATIVGYAHIRMSVVKNEKSGTKRARDTGRVLSMRPTTAYDAKTRYEIREHVPLSWAAFREAFDEAQGIENISPTTIEDEEGGEV